MQNNVPKIRLMIIYHSGMTEASQKIFDEFSKSEFIEEILVLAPYKISVDKIYNPSDFLELKKTIKKNNLTIKPIGFMKIGKYYLINPISLLIKIFKFKPSAILALNEGYSSDLFSVSFIRKFISIFCLKPKIFFYQFENINKYKIYGLKKKIVAWFIKKNVKYGFFCSEGAKQALSQPGWFPKLKNVWWGVDIKSFQKEISAAEIGAYKKQLGIPTNHKIIGFAGRLVPEKGINDLIGAFLKIKIPSTLLLAGDGPERNNLEKIKNSLQKTEKQIIILPSQTFSQMPLVYKLMDVLVLPSRTTEDWKEQYGRVLIEAMASGVAVAGSSSGAIPEIIDNMGSIFKQGDVEGLKNAILNELNNFSSEKKKKLQKYSEKGSIENFTKKIINFIIYCDEN
ncbi:MAG: glycosyltransferase family 4 protein [bacterium]